MLPIVSFFVVFTLIIQMTKFDLIESLDQIIFINMLHIWNLRYFKYYWTFKYIGLESIIFAINMNVVSFSKIFSILEFVFLLIDCITNLNQ